MLADTHTWCDLNIKRGPLSGPLRSTIGLIVRISVDPSVEEFMKLSSTGKIQPVEAHGPSWVPLNNGESLQVYATNKFNNGNPRYTLDHIGRPLLIDTRGVGDYSQSIPNLSFLKLVGIGSPDGIAFGVAGAYSFDYAQTLKRVLLLEVQQFLRDYVVPLNINLKIYSSK